MPDSNEVISKATDFLDKIKSDDQVTIKFTKKDGSERIMRCTLNFDKIPKQNRPKSVNLSKILKLLNDKGIIHVFDLDKKDWRSVPFKESQWILTSSNIKYRIKKS